MPERMIICVATQDHLKIPCEQWVPTGDLAIASEQSVGSPVAAYQRLYKPYKVSPFEILAYIHDDVEIFEKGWGQRVLTAFEDPTVGLVGFGGGVAHGDSSLYKTPYRLQQLARQGYLSNTRDAESHGQRFDGVTEVAVLDGFALIVRREILDRAWRQTPEGPRNGWPVDRLCFHCYDYALGCWTHRLGYKIMLVGIDCIHHGGRSSTSPAYQDWLKSRGTSDAQDHEQSHRWIYDEFRDVLPWPKV